MPAKEAISRIIEHNVIHSRKERNAILITKALNMAVEALERQIPKKPDISGDSCDKNGNLIYDTYDCPNCHVNYELEYDKYDYCPSCGQALDWSEEVNENGQNQN